MSEGPRKKLPVRWLTLAELVGILALVVAALGWWDNHREKQQQDRERAISDQRMAAEARRQALKSTFLLVGQVGDDGQRIRLSSAHSDQVIQTQTLVFPQAIRRDTVETTGNPRIDRGWLEDGLKQALHDRGKPQGAVRVPVGVVTTYVDGGEIKTDRSIYLIGATLKSRLLRGATLKFEGLSLSRRGVPGDLQAAVDAAWGR
jgi:hypothetical protein